MNNENHIKKVGGQAVISGIMMKSETAASLAIKLPNNEIEIQTFKTKNRKKINKIPIVRGIVETISSLTLGYRCLLISAQKASISSNSNKTSLNKTQNSKLETSLSVIISLMLTIALFIVLPTLAIKSSFFNNLNSNIKSAIEGLIKITIFIIYLAITSLNSEFKKIYKYHGAEHKTIACYEAKKELNICNVKKFSRFHPKCGTSFVLIALIVSIAISSMISWKSIFLRTLYKIVLVPIIVGISYEIVKIVTKHKNSLTRILIKPGLLLQHLTTKEPDEIEIKVAIKALKQLI